MEGRRDEIGSIAVDKLPDLVISGVGGLSAASSFVVDGVALAVMVGFTFGFFYLLYHRFVIKDFKFFGPEKGFQTERVVWKVRKRRRRKVYGGNGGE